MVTPALFRFCLGIYNFLVIYLYLWPIRYFIISNNGIFPASTFYQRSYLCLNRCSLFDKRLKIFHNPTLITLIAIISSLSLCLGFFTTTSAILLYLSFSSIVTRNVFIRGGPDVVNRQCLFWIVFMNSGQCLSIDSILNESNFYSAYGNPLAVRVLQILVFQIYYLSCLLYTSPSPRD